MSAITTHVLDTSAGRPAPGVAVSLHRQTASDEWESLGQAATDADGRARALVSPDAPIVPGIYRLTFDTRAYFDARGTRTFYPHVVVVFEVVDEAHHHVPLLISPWGYTTYRGS